MCTAAAEEATIPQMSWLQEASGKVEVKGQSQYSEQGVNDVMWQKSEEW